MKKIISCLLLFSNFVFANEALTVSCETYFSDQTPVQRQIQVGVSTAIVYDLEKNEVLTGETSFVEAQLASMKMQGYVIILNMKNWDPDIYEVGLGHIVLDGKQGSLIDKDNIYSMQSISANLWIGIRVDSENFLETKCHEAINN
jgi:hypothetical protein